LRKLILPFSRTVDAAKTEKSNFCEYFDLNPGTYSGATTSQVKIGEAKLAERFGQGPELMDTEVPTASPISSLLPDPESAREELNRLFKKD
jgi:hypothetical protein|tara:strand:- start:380 stop:652 length:273 start_codon:yes stop_codon:yes gene_type:complete